jgi:hypothetical protein
MIYHPSATLDDWLRDKAIPAYDAYCADPSRGLTLEEVRATIGENAARPCKLRGRPS